MKNGWATLAICVALMGVHGLLARSAVVQKNAVYDEPLHTAAGWMVRERGDYRIDKEDPALFLLYSSLTLNENSIDPSKFDDLPPRVPSEHPEQWRFVTGVLYRTPGTDGEAVIQRARWMFIPITCLLGGTIAWLAFRLGGSWAAIIAAIFYAFDPNFLGHGAIVKNDVMLALFMLIFSINLWRIGQRATPWNLLSIGLIIGGALCVKFSGMLFVPMLVLAMMVRVMLPSPWRWMNREILTKPGRVGLAMSVCLVAAMVSFTTIWAIYRFRFLPTNDPSQQFDMGKLVWLAKNNTLLGKIAEPTAPPPTNEQIAAFDPGLLVKGIVFANDHRLLPQTWLAGLLYTQATTQIRATYLLGMYSYVGWWYFFPVAMLVKTPTASLIAFAVSIYLVFRRRFPSMDGWTIIALGIAPVIYFAMAVLSNLNLGLRHILPVYPALFVVIALAMSRWIELAKGRKIVAVLGAMLLVESLYAYPNYIAFFNTPSDKTAGRLRLLSDSNFDWGQDIKTLKKWQDAHPEVHIYFAGFGMADADFLGLRRTDLSDNRGFVTNPEPLGVKRGVVAISATVLQGTYLDANRRGLYGEFRRLQPREVLGGTIYLYDWP